MFSITVRNRVGNTVPKEAECAYRNNDFIIIQ